MPDRTSASPTKTGAATRPAAKAAESDKADSRPRKPTRSAAKKRPANSAAIKAAATKSKGPAPGGKPVLLSGGNPRIAKAEGDAPVQAYIAAMPGWKSDVGRRLDALIARTVPACGRR